MVPKKTDNHNFKILLASAIIGLLAFFYAALHFKTGTHLSPDHGNLKETYRYLELEKQATTNILEKTSPETVEKLDQMWESLHHYGYFEVENEKQAVMYRKAIVCFQAIIEKALAKALIEQEISSVRQFSITPGAPSPLRGTETKGFEAIDLEDVSDLVALRRETMLGILNSGGQINAIYTTLANTEAPFNFGLQAYQELLRAYQDNLKDYPIITFDPFKFPKDVTGAVYIINNDENNMIIIKSFQLNQGESGKWSIAIGKRAKDQLATINSFLNKHTIKGFEIAPIATP